MGNEGRRRLKEEGTRMEYKRAKEKETMNERKSGGYEKKKRGTKRKSEEAKED